ncbi:hypothetical protein KAI87_09195 [Myxococcota bacterium]|nr:hypothetical protein [Myxococcota bacterium]
MAAILRHGSDQVDPGLYWDVMTGERAEFKEAGVLPGDPTTNWVKLPLVAMLLVGPLFGFAYAMFLPLTGFLMPMVAIVFKNNGTKNDTKSSPETLGENSDDKKEDS